MTDQLTVDRVTLALTGELWPGARVKHCVNGVVDHHNVIGVVLGKTAGGYWQVDWTLTDGERVVHAYLRDYLVLV